MPDEGNPVSELQGFPKEADLIGRELKQVPDGPRCEGGDQQAARGSARSRRAARWS